MRRSGPPEITQRNPSSTDQRISRHEIASALAALEGAAAALLALGPAEGPEQRLPRAMRAEILRLRELLQHPVTVADGDSEVVDLPRLLEALVTVETGRIRDVSLQVPDDLVVFGRQGAITQIVRTLLDNARRHAPGSPVDVTVTCRGQVVHLEVADRGRGVPAFERQRIFEIGQRGAFADAPGDGFGLALARRTARTMGGNIWVRPRPGGGSVFVVELLAADHHAASVVA